VDVPIGAPIPIEEAIVTILALITLGILLVAVRASKATSPEQSLGGRIASLLAAGGIIIYWWSRWYLQYQEVPFEWRYAIPIIAATIAVAASVLLSGRRTSPEPLGEVDLTPRSLWSYGSRSWFAGWWALNVLVAGTVLLAGWTSSPDQHGRYTMIEIHVGGNTFGADLFGWAFGIPVLIALGALVLIAHLALWLIARPAVPANPIQRDREGADRRNRTRTVLAIASGGTAFTLGLSWQFIGRSALLGASLHFDGFDGHAIYVGTSFAALSLPLTILGFLLEGIGLALVLLGLFQPRRRAGGSADAEHAPPASVSSVQ
jgi:hypothetical protein